MRDARDGIHQLGDEWAWWRTALFMDRDRRGNVNTRITDDAGNGGANFLGRLRGHDAAVHVGRRGLRKGIVRMSARQPRRDAGRAKHGVVARVARQDRRCTGIRLARDDGTHRGADLR